jgi:hypothetical protein
LVEHLASIGDEWVGLDYTQSPLLDDGDFDFEELLGGQASSSWYAPPPPPQHDVLCSNA